MTTYFAANYFSVYFTPEYFGPQSTVSSASDGATYVYSGGSATLLANHRLVATEATYTVAVADAILAGYFPPARFFLYCTAIRDILSVGEPVEDTLKTESSLEDTLKTESSLEDTLEAGGLLE